MGAPVLCTGGGGSCTRGSDCWHGCGGGCSGAGRGEGGKRQGGGRGRGTCSVGIPNVEGEDASPSGAGGLHVSHSDWPHAHAGHVDPDGAP